MSACKKRVSPRKKRKQGYTIRQMATKIIVAMLIFYAVWSVRYTGQLHLVTLPDGFQHYEEAGSVIPALVVMLGLIAWRIIATVKLLPQKMLVAESKPVDCMKLGAEVFVVCACLFVLVGSLHPNHNFESLITKALGI